MNTTHIEITPDYLASQGLSPDFAEKFWQRVFFITYDKGCWIWTGNLNAYGYGRFHTDIKRGTRIEAHRASWLLNYGPIPKGMCVLHKCDNPPCVRPDHLWIGTRTDNALDRDIKQRLPWGDNCPHTKISQSRLSELIVMCNEENSRQWDIARTFGVNQSTVSRIWHHKRRNTH